MASEQHDDAETRNGAQLESQKTREDVRHGNHSPSSLEQVESKVERPQGLLKEAVFVVVMSSAQFLTQAGVNQALSPLHIIGDSFGITDPAPLSWLIAGYSLTVGTFILIAGRLGDVFGHKKFFVAGFVWFGVWSIIAGLSVYTNSIFFDFCRGMQGIGPAFLLPNAIAILSRSYEPGRRKNFVMSIFGATAPIGAVFGLLFASLLSQLAWWPWAFWIMGIVCFGMAVLGIYVIPHAPPTKREDGVSVLSLIDAPGAITGVAGLVFINVAWNQGPLVSWTTPYTYVLLIIGLLFMALFAYIELHVKYPLIPVDGVSSSTAFILGCIATGWATFGIWLFYTWQFLEVLRGQTPLMTTAQFSPVAISGGVAAVTTGLILGFTPPGIVMLIALLAFTTGTILIATAPVNQTYWAQVFVSIIVMPWGMDMSFPAATILLGETMPRKYQGSAASLVNTVLNYSISLGLGFAGTVESQVNMGGADVLKGYRGALYMGIGLGGLGVLIAATFAVKSTREHRKSAKNKG